MPEWGKRSELDNLYMLARRARDTDNAEDAARYYDMIQLKDPTSWEAYFYSIYFRAMQSTIANMETACSNITNSIGDSLRLIEKNFPNRTERNLAICELRLRTEMIALNM